MILKKHGLRLFVVGGCHGNELSVMGATLYVCVLSFIKGLSSRRRRREGMQCVQTAKSNMLLNLNLRDVLLRGPRRAHHDNPIAPSCCSRRLARALALASSRMH